MSRQMRNDKVIGGSSNNASAILYKPADTSRAETNVEAELDRMNVDLSETTVIEINTPTTGTYHFVALPPGWALDDCVFKGVTYYNSGNGSWYALTGTDKVCALMNNGSTPSVGAYTNDVTATKFRAVVWKYK